MDEAPSSMLLSYDMGILGCVFRLSKCIENSNESAATKKLKLPHVRNWQ